MSSEADRPWKKHGLSRTAPLFIIHPLIRGLILTDVREGTPSLSGKRLAGAERVALEEPAAEDIRKALDAAEFEPYFQPIVALADGRVVGFEALARWRSAERGLVPPIEFVGLAEASGLIREIDNAILEHAWRALDEALEACPYPEINAVLSVN